jgi:LPS-assembly protein
MLFTLISNRYCLIKRLTVIFFFLFSTAAYSFDSKYDNLSVNDPEKPWEITADEITYFKKTNDYVARGNVIISKAGSKITADVVRFDHNHMKAYATGHVTVAMGEDRLSGSSMDIDLDNETGVVSDGRMFIKENNFHITGDKINKIGQDTYEVDNASVSTCDGDTPVWKITGKKLKVNLEGYGFIDHAAFWTKKMPVLYAPFLVFPVKTERQSGLLPAQIGYSDRRGMEFSQPLYWAISESSDATLYSNYMGLRGIKYGLEYRYVIDDESKGTIMYDFLDDRKVDNGISDTSDDWGYNDRGENILRPNSDRYWFRMKNDQDIPYGFSAKLDIDVVSDQDYLHEFKDGYSGFKDTEKYFEKYFYRELDDFDDPVRTNRLNISKSWNRFNFNAQTLWYDDVIARRQTRIDKNMQQLPFLGFDASKQKIMETPFYWDLNSEYTYLYSQDDARGHRADIYTRLYLPKRYKNYFSFEPSIGLRETHWNIEQYKGDERDKDKVNSRELYDVKLDFSTEIFKVYQVNTGIVEKIKHTIRSKVVYDYLPETSQDGLPSFNALSDGINRINKENLITGSVINTFVSRSKKQTSQPEDQTDMFSNYTYRQLCRLKLEQSYDINEEKEEDPSRWKDGLHKRPFYPLYGKIEFNPFKYLSFEADAQWSFYESTFLSHNLELKASNNRSDAIYIEYRYNKDFNRSVYANLFVNLTERLATFGDWERDLFEKKDIEKGLGFIYSAQCWSLSVGFTNDEGDIKYEFMVAFSGLGGFGKSRAESFDRRK